MIGFAEIKKQDISNLCHDKELEQLSLPSVYYYEPNPPSYKIVEDLVSSNCKMISTSRTSRIYEKINTLSIINDEEFMNKWSNLLDLFEREYKKYGDSISCDYIRVKSEFEYSLNSILKMSPDIISVGAEEDCVFIYAEYGNKSIFFNLFFEEEVTEAIVNIAEDTNPVMSYSNTVENSLNELKKAIGKADEEVSYIALFDLLI